MNELTDRMRTCAAHLASVGIGASTQAIDSAADLLIEAATEIELLAGPVDLGEPMEVIPPMQQAARLQQPIVSNMPPGTWTAAGDTLPVANPYRSRHTCPKCDSRANKTVRRVANEVMLICPACAHEWPYAKKPLAGGTGAAE